MFERHARTVSVLTLVSRVTGLARDAVLSRVFGAGVLMDAFFFAFLMPNLFRRLFGEGALSAAFLPKYSELVRADVAQARRLATLLIGRVTVGLGLVVMVGEVLLLGLAALGGGDTLAVWLMMVMLPYMPLVCVVALLGAMLQVHGRFGPPAAAPVVLNVCVIAAALIGAQWWMGSDGKYAHLHIGAVAGSVVLAGVVQMAWSLWALRREDWWVKEKIAPDDGARGAFREVLRKAGPMIVGLGVLQVNTLFDGLIASYPTTIGGTIFGVEYPLQQGAMSAVSYAQRLYQFPLGVFGIAVATAIFPLLARLVDDAEGFGDALRRGLRLVVFIGVPASAGLMLVREDLAAVVLEGGAFDADDRAAVSWVLLGYAPAVWAYSMVHVVTRAFYARGDSMTPVKVAVGVVGLNVVLNVTLIWTPLREAGLAWSTAVCSAVQAAVLVWVLTKRTRLRVVDAAVLGSWRRTVLVTAAMVGAVWAAAWWMGDGATWTGYLLRLLGMVGVGMVVFGGAALAWRMPEVRWALGAEGSEADS